MPITQNVIAAPTPSPDGRPGHRQLRRIPVLRKLLAEIAGAEPVRYGWHGLPGTLPRP